MQFPPPPAHYKNAISLEPPPIPPQKHIQVFGYPLYSSFEEQMKENEQTWSTLFPAGTPTQNVESLQNLNVSLLFNYIELVDVLLKDPTLYMLKVDHIRQIMASMHHLINAFRPAQATNFAVWLLETQVQRRRELLQKINECITKADAILTKATEKLQTASASNISISDIKNEAQALESSFQDVEMDASAPHKPQKSAASAAIATRQGMARLNQKLLDVLQQFNVNGGQT